MRPREMFALAKRAVSEWIDDKAPSRAASLSYYTVFSIAPLLVIAVALAGLAFGREAVTGELHRQLQGELGDGGANAIEEMMKSASHTGSGVVATVLGLIMLVVGATGAFVELEDALNAMWHVEKRKTSGVITFIRARILSFAMVGVIAFLLLTSLVVSTALSALGRFAEQRLPGGEAIFQIVDILVSLLVITALFAAIYKVLPDAKVAWRDVWFGAGVTSFLFAIGKFLIGLYLGKSSVASSYGAAGSFAMLLIWINYSSMIMFLGAEFTQVYARYHGSLKGVAETPATAAKEASTA